MPHNLDFSIPNTLICTRTHRPIIRFQTLLLAMFFFFPALQCRYREGCHDFPTCCVGRHWQRFGTGSCGCSTQWPHLCGALCSPTMGHWILHPDHENLHHGRVPWLWVTWRKAKLYTFKIILGLPPVPGAWCVSESSCSNAEVGLFLLIFLQSWYTMPHFKYLLGNLAALVLH